MNTPTVTERIDMGIATARETSASVVAAVLPVVTNAQSASEAAVAFVQQQTAGFQAQVQARLAPTAKAHAPAAAVPAAPTGAVPAPAPASGSAASPAPTSIKPANGPAAFPAKVEE
jgi:conjugal transfer pilus assembly protein TraV